MDDQRGVESENRFEHMSDLRFLPYTRQCIDDADIAAVTEVLRGDWLTTGPTIGRFETELARVVGARHAVVCSSGTAAIHLVCMALGMGPGDISVVPTVTFVATANGSRYTGADVVFADVDPETGLMRPDDFKRALDRIVERPVKAVFVVHLNGQVGALEEIAELAAERGVSVVEDACHALGTKCVTEGGGTALTGDCQFSDMTVFSFHAAKTVAMGEGGAITTNNEELATRLRASREHGIVRADQLFENEKEAFDSNGRTNPWYYEMPELGFNYRASDIQCALGISQLSKLETFSDRRRELMRQYDRQLSSLWPVVRPVRRTNGCDPILHLYPVLVDFDALATSRAELIRTLRGRGIGTQVHYFPVHLQVYYQRLYGTHDLPDAAQYYRSTLSLPFYTAMSDDDVTRVVQTIKAVLGL